MTNSFPLVSHSKVKAPAGVGTKSVFGIVVAFVVVVLKKQFNKKYFL
jgi:hypothetical protein